MARILIATSTTDFDPTEVSVPWRILRDAGHEIQFATDTGKAGQADGRMLSGAGFGWLKSLLIARPDAQADYQAMLVDPAFQKPLTYDAITGGNFDGLVLPGGHAKGMLPYLESKTLQTAIAGFFTADKPVGAICHGVVAACRAIDPKTGKSVLFGRKTTALLNRQELLAWRLTKRKHGDYFRTYPETVEDEVTACLQSSDDFVQGPTPLLRDTPNTLARGFTLRDRNYLSARWPGDAHRFATEFERMF